MRKENEILARNQETEKERTDMWLKKLNRNQNNALEIETTNFVELNFNNAIFSLQLAMAAKYLQGEAEEIMKKLGTGMSNWSLTKRSAQNFMSEQSWEFEEDDSNQLVDTPVLEYIRKTKSAQFFIRIFAVDFDMSKITEKLINTSLAKPPEVFYDLDADIRYRCVKIDKDQNRWYYDIDSENWEIEKQAETEVMPEEEWAVTQYIEKHADEMIDEYYEEDLHKLAEQYDCTSVRELEEIIRSYHAILELRNRTQPYTKLDFIHLNDGRIEPAICPDNEKRQGFVVYADRNEYVLCQYTDAVCINAMDPSEIPEKEIFMVSQISDVDEWQQNTYCREVGRTSDLSAMEKIVNGLAGLYTRVFMYTIPLSLDSSVTVNIIEELLRPESFRNERDQKMTEEEKENLNAAAHGFLYQLGISRRMKMESQPGTFIDVMKRF